MIDKNISDEALIELLRQSENPRYFSILSDRYEKYIFIQCKSYVKNIEIAQDLCQEVLIRVYGKLNNFHGEAKFKTWLYAIIHNICIDYMRKHKRNVHAILTEKMAEEVPEMIDGAENIPKELTISLMESLLEQISPEEKLILLLKYKERHSIKDIMLTLHLSESAVKMRLKRARGKLNAMYTKME